MHHSGDRHGAFVRRGILWFGIPIGAVVTVLVVMGWLHGLGHVPAGVEWGRLTLLVVLNTLEWVVGLGWVIGQVLWFLHQHPLNGRGS